MVRYDIEDTICAVASPPGPGHRGVIRISGPDALNCTALFFVSLNCRKLEQVSTRDVVPGRIRNEQDLWIDALLLVWPDQRSYTRQPSIEIHTLGSPALLQILSNKVIENGARLAEPGEFTLRAFLAGRLDLTQAEAVLGVIDAEGESQLKTALEQLAGGLANPLNALRSQLLRILAEIEAGLDFVEEDIEFISQQQIDDRLSEIENQLRQLLNQIETRSQAQEAIRVVLIGLPNAGKSSLFNSLVGASKAIVSKQAGTTTDYVSAQIELSGMQVELVDTAGLEAAAEFVGQSAQAQRAAQQSTADLILLCIDPHQLPNEPEDSRSQLESLSKQASFLVFTKSDLKSPSGGTPFTDQFLSDFKERIINTSSVSQRRHRKPQAETGIRFAIPSSQWKKYRFNASASQGKLDQRT